MIQVNRIYLIFNRLVTKKFLVDTSVSESKVTVGFLASGSFFKKEPKTLNTIFFHLLTYVFGKNSMAFRKGMIAVWGL